MANLSRGERTKYELINVGLQVWHREGYERVTVTHVSSLVGLTHGSALYHFKSSEGMRDAIARQAVWNRDAIIIPQLIVMRHKAVSHFTAEQRANWLAAYTDA